MSERGGADAPSRRSVDGGSEEEDERHHHTLTLAEGRALRRELSRHQLFDGSALVDESSPETTLGTVEAAELASAVRVEVGGVGGEFPRGTSATRRTSVDGSGIRRGTGVSPKYTPRRLRSQKSMIARTRPGV